MAQKISSPVTGVVWKVEAKIGDALAAGATILLVESMKMEIPVAMPRAGKLTSLLVKQDDNINEGQILAEIE